MMLEPYLREPESPVNGDILFYNNNKWIRLPIGQEGQFLTVNTGIPTWVSVSTAPGPPTGVSATAGNVQATVSFTAPLNSGGSAITGYTVTSIPGNFTATGATSPINVTGLTNGTPYTFTVVATNSVGNSVASAASSAVIPVTVPGAPTTVVATAGNTSASVAFIAPASDGGSVITIYTVTSNPEGRTATGSSSPLTVTGLTNGTVYTFTVIATTAVGNSVASAASFAVTPVTVPGAPISVVATAGNTSASVAFVAPDSNGGSAITNYTVTSNPAGGSATGSSSPLTVTGLTNGISYTFTVVATSAVGNSVASAASSAITPVTVPGAPTGVVATAGNTSASVAFIAPVSNGGSAITGYTVTSNPEGRTATGPSSPLTVTGLTNGTSYTFTVIATTAVGNSVASAASSAVTPVTVPGAPTGVVATAGNTSVSVAFVAPASNGGSVITGYTVTSNPEGRTATGPSSPLTVTGLTNGTSYTFTVIATNAVGPSVASAASSAVIPSFSCGTSTVSDIDGNFYNTVSIGTQCWMQANLKTSRYRNGGSIPNVTDNTLWSTNRTGAWSYWNNDISYNAIYGKYYNWYTTIGDTLCPSGWHVPSDSDFNKLVKILDSGADTSSASSTHSSTAGGYLKSTDTYPTPYGWNSPNIATNSSLFSALPGGLRFNYGSFDDNQRYAYFWSASEKDYTDARYRILFHNIGSVYRTYNDKSFGFSVRCLKD
jgi:uncharacterized protein (TIGR02145 family)